MITVDFRYFNNLIINYMIGFWKKYTNRITCILFFNSSIKDLMIIKVVTLKFFMVIL